MIIKSMSRKQPSFWQLIDYMQDCGKADLKFNIYCNVFSRQAQAVYQEFMENAELLQRRKNGVYLYHEILSITRTANLSLKEQKEKLFQIAYEYLNKRAANNLVLGVMHEDHDDNLHYHLMISSNELGESKKHRLSKKQFEVIKCDLEKRVLQNMPELEQKVAINKKAERKLSKKGAELNRRSGKTSQRDQVIEKLRAAFQAQSRQAFFDRLAEAKLEIYIRGQNIGVIDKEHNRKHRIKSLGLLEEFNAMSELFEAEQQQKTEKSTQKQAETSHNNENKNNNEKQQSENSGMGADKQNEKYDWEQNEDPLKDDGNFVRDTLYDVAKEGFDTVQETAHSMATGDSPNFDDEKKQSVDDIIKKRMQEMEDLQSSNSHSSSHKRKQ